MNDPSLLLRWPSVPEEQRPKKLFHAGLVTPEVDVVLIAKGWLPVDVRLLPNRTDVDRAESLKDWLEGVRLGTIEPDPKAAKFVELEARVYGLAQGKGPTGKRSSEPESDVNASRLDAKSVLESFGTSRPFSMSADERITASKKKNGRPKIEE